MGALILFLRNVTSKPVTAKAKVVIVRKLIIAALPAFILVGCSSLGLAPASNFIDRLAYSYGTHTAVLTSATQSLEAGELDSAYASRVLKIADEARTALDVGSLPMAWGGVTTVKGACSSPPQFLLSCRLT